MLPCVTFILGMKYQQLRNYSNNEALPSPDINSSSKLPGSTPGWVKYVDPQKRFSFEFPEGWSYDGLFLYSVDIDKLHPAKKESGVFWRDNLKVLFEISSQKLSDYINKVYINDKNYKYKVISQTHEKFGQTDVVTYKLCNSVRVQSKGNYYYDPGKYCTNVSFIDLDEKGYLSVGIKAATEDGELTNEGELFKSVLQTVHKQ